MKYCVLKSVCVICAFASASTGKAQPGDSQPRFRERTPPTVLEVQQRAVEYVRANPGEVDEMLLRARMSSALPELRFRPWVYIDRDQKFEVDHEAVRAPQQTQMDDNSFRLEVRATWNLNEVIYHPDEVRLRDDAVKLAEYRTEVRIEATRAYFAYREAEDELAEGIRLHASALEIRAAEEKVLECAAILDALTDGWFTEKRQS